LLGSGAAAHVAIAPMNMKRTTTRRESNRYSNKLLAFRVYARTSGETEFVTISYWESVEAMSRFTGGDPTRIHHLARDPEFLVELPQHVQILNIRTSQG